jgi:predicted O-methyltransferase YrrM
MKQESGIDDVPELVAKAMRLAEVMGFDRSCSLETGRLLRTLAAQVESGIIGEIGSGCGVGAAWISSGMRGDVSLVTVELEETRAKAVKELLGGVSRVQVMQGDWREILARGPFALLFADSAAAKYEAETLLGALRRGGLILLDDLTPGGSGGPDPLREFWLKDGRVVGAEVQVRATEAVILAVRVQ